MHAPITGLVALTLLLAGAYVEANIKLAHTIAAAAQGDPQLDDIGGMFVDTQGRLYLTESKAGRLIVVGGEAVKSIELAGKEKGPFSSPRLAGVAPLGPDRLAVVNSGQGVVAVLDLGGKPHYLFGEQGRQAGKLSEPRGIAYSPRERLYVADSGNDRVNVYSRDGVFLFDFGAAVGGKADLRAPSDIAVDAAERVYVLDREGAGRLSVYDHSGKLLKRLSAEALKHDARKTPELAALALAADGTVLLADAENGRILQVEWQAGKLVRAFGSRGKGRGQFLNVAALALSPTQRLAVADARNRKIELYDLTDAVGAPLASELRLPALRLGAERAGTCDRAYALADGSLLCVGTQKRSVTRYVEGAQPIALQGPFARPTLAAADDKDIVIVDDTELKVHGLDGKLRFVFGRSGAKDGRFRGISGIALRDRIYVADGAERVQIFSRDGVYIDKLANRSGEPPLMRRPGPIAVDGQGRLYVADEGLARVRVFSAKKELLYELGDEESSAHRYKGFTDIALDGDTQLYVLASTVSNEHVVHVYRDKRRVFSFGFAAQARGGLAEPTTLAVPPGKRTTVYVHDRLRQALSAFEFMQVPPPVEALSARGGVETTRLRWRAAAAAFVDHYSVYGASAPDGAYVKLAESAAPMASVAHGAERHAYYRVAAVSGFGVEGQPSAPALDLFQQAYALYQRGGHERAGELFARLYERDSAHAEALQYLGLSLVQRRRYDEAVARFRELARKPGFETVAANHEAQALVSAKRFIEARAALDKAVAEGRANGETYLWCGRVALALADFAGAANCLEQATAGAPQDVSARLLLGEAYLRIGAVDRGLEQFERAATLAPRDAAVLVEGARAYHALGRHEQALARFERALAIDPLYGPARLGAARTHIELQQHEPARALALSMAGIPEQQAAGQYLLGIIALQTGRTQEALLALARAAAKEPDDADVWLALADAHLRLGDSAQARSALASVIKADPNSFAAHLRLAQLAQQAKDHAGAAERFAKATALRPSDYDARYGYAESLAALERFPEAAVQAREAARLTPASGQALLLAADIAHKQGRDGEAINHLQKALAREPASALIELKLGARYLENNIFDLAQQHLDRAAAKDQRSAEAQLLLGRLFLKRRLHDEAIKAFSRAVELDASEANAAELNLAYAEKRKSLEFGYNAPPLVLRDLRLERVFSGAYKQYADAPIGQVTVANTGTEAYQNLKLSFHVKGYMDFPLTHDIVALGANESVALPLRAAFSNKILEIDEDTGVLVEIRLSFHRGGQQDSISMTQPITIYGKNAIVWRDVDMVGSFVTPKDESLKEFVRQAINLYRPDGSGPLNDHLLSAMTWFNVLAAHGLRYVVDPNSPYPELTKDQVDHVQFPRETLRLKSGDCDDLSVLLAAGLENLGIATAMADVPGHLFVLFSTGLPERERHLISLQEELTVVRDGEVWIPLEATMIATSFSEAWAEGARKYQHWRQQNELRVVPLKRAWQRYFPVTLAPARYSLHPPSGEQVKNLIERERTVLVEKGLERELVPYRALLRANPSDVQARIQIGIIYAKNGLSALGAAEFEQALRFAPGDSAAHNNRGNVYYIQGEYVRALEAYRRAEELDPRDAGIKINLALAYYRLGQLPAAVAKHTEAAALDPAVAERYKSLQRLLRP